MSKVDFEIRLLKSLQDQGEISEKQKKGLIPIRFPTRCSVWAKIHKLLEDGIPSFRPVLSAIGTPTYKLAKFCEQLLKPLINNEYKIKTSFSFAKEVLEFHASLFLASFDIKSLFTNIPPAETLNLCVQNRYRNQTHIGNLIQGSFYSLLKITMSE